MTTSIEDMIAQAIGDPGSITDRREGETVTRWATRAVGTLLATVYGPDTDGYYAGTPATRALMENGTLRAWLADARSMLNEYVDDEPCRLDHHGACQDHGGTGGTGGDGEQCVNVRANAFLAMSADDIVARRHGPAPSPAADGHGLAAELAVLETKLGEARTAAPTCGVTCTEVAQRMLLRPGQIGMRVGECGLAPNHKGPHDPFPHEGCTCTMDNRTDPPTVYDRERECPLHGENSDE